MNNVLFRRGDQTFIDENVPLNDGQIIFNETDEAIYVDTLINSSVVRKRYGGGNLSRSDIDMALSTTSENPVANKVLTELMLQKADVIDDLGTALAVTENGVPTGCKTIQGLNTSLKTLVVDIPSFSSLPQTINNTNITSDMIVVNSVLSTPSAQTSDWTVTTSTGSLTITGTISGSTSVTLYLTKSR
jgi:hypothetical protein